jgi:hypothetical protein
VHLQQPSLHRQDRAQPSTLLPPSDPGSEPHKARVEVATQRSYSSADLCWSGGSKTDVKALHQTATGLESIDLVAVSPWSGQSWGGAIPDDVMLVEHRIFCGKDMGITCIVSPTSAFLPKLTLAPAPTLTAEEAMVLTAHKSLISSYRPEAYARAGIRQAQLATLVAALADRGLLKVNKAGSSQITNEGKNALAALPASARPVL